MMMGAVDHLLEYTEALFQAHNMKKTREDLVHQKYRELDRNFLKDLYYHHHRMNEHLLDKDNYYHLYQARMDS